MNRLITWGVALALMAFLTASSLAQLTAYTWVTGLSSVVLVIQDPTDSNTWYAVQQTGRVRVIQGGVIQGTDFIDLSNLIYVPGPPPDSLGERGLLGMEFDPNYASNGLVYFNYNDRTGNGNTQISRFTRTLGNPYQLAAGSEFKILNVSQPFVNHKGGTIRFGADGFLYLGMGDGGSANDPGNRAQDPNTLLGKMLRIDVSHDGFPADPLRNYAIPPDNPFVDGLPIPAMGEIWAFGMRNPFKWTFDRLGNNALIIGDVGQASWEEIDYEPAGMGGRNYAWRMREGLHTINGGAGAYGASPWNDPIHEYARGSGAAITGGYVYRGSLLGPAYAGRYFFADFVQRRVWSIGLTIGAGGEGSMTPGSLIEHTTELGGSTFLGNISSIDIDKNGELYLVRYGGAILRLLPAGPIDVAPDAFNLTVGVFNSGTVASMKQSDDQWFVIGRAPGGVPAPQAEIIIDGASARFATSQITVRVESHMSLGARQYIDAFNFATNTWVPLENAVVSTTDVVRTVNITASPGSFIQPGTGKVRIRLGYHEGRAARNWFASIDQMKWTVNP